MKKQRAGAAYKKAAGALSSATLDRARNAVTYRIYGCEEARMEKYEEALSLYEKTAVRNNVWQSALPPLYLAASEAGTLFILWFGAKNVLGTGWNHWDIAASLTFPSCFAWGRVKSSKVAKLFQRGAKGRGLLEAHQTPDENARAAGCPADPGGTGCGAERTRLLLWRRACLLRPEPDGPSRRYHRHHRPGRLRKIHHWPRISLRSALSGSVCFGGREFSALTPRQIAATVGYLGHDPELSADTVQNNVLCGSEQDAMPWQPPP